MTRSARLSFNLLLKPNWPLAAIVVLETIAVLCQFLQRTDPRFPLVYFTVWSGILAGMVAASQLVSREYRFQPIAKSAAAVGVVVSAVIFALVITPATYTGTWFQPWDDIYVRIANTVFHGLAPAFVFLDFVLTPPNGRFRYCLAAACCWSLIYLVFVATAAVVFHVEVPYKFMDPDVMAWNTILLATFAVLGLIVVTTAVLFITAKFLQKRINRRIV